jgi:hypothetical protein
MGIPTADAPASGSNDPCDEEAVSSAPAMSNAT